MTTRKLVLFSAALVFLVVAAASLYRFLFGFAITIAGQSVGQASTFLIMVASAGFSLLLFREAMLESGHSE